MSQSTAAGPRIAIVDDDHGICRALERLLRSCGYEVSAYASAAEFLRSLRVARPVCVLLDLHMPEIDGLRVLETLVEHYKGIAVVVVTAETDPDVLARADALGASALISKPVEPDSLLEAVSAALP